MGKGVGIGNASGASGLVGWAAGLVPATWPAVAAMRGATAGGENAEKPEQKPDDATPARRKKGAAGGWRPGRGATAGRRR
ncbi:hypothetical protein NL676_034919 [Syzygium grande]|nr:hypothetical protein NL676_034919 [Syzygium grande]